MSWRVREVGRIGTAAIVAVAAAAPVEAQDVGIPIGTIPEAVILEDLDGQPVDLGSWVGDGPLLLEFWATWCPICQALQPHLDEAYARYGDRVRFAAVAVGVNQSPRTIRRHLEDHPLPYPMLWDGRGRATRAYRAPTTGYVVILDADGRVAYTGVGEDQELDAALRRVVGSTGGADRDGRVADVVP